MNENLESEVLSSSIRIPWTSILPLSIFCFVHLFGSRLLLRAGRTHTTAYLSPEADAPAHCQSGDLCVDNGFPVGIGNREPEVVCVSKLKGE